MSEISRFFNSIDHDRLYSAADWAAYFRGESGDPARVDPVRHDPVSAAEESQRAGNLGQAVSAAGVD